MKVKVLDKVLENIEVLQKTPMDDWARVFVALKIEFAKDYQQGLIFSTRFGAAFFEEILYWLERDDYLKSSDSQPLGQYDKNFNTWLKLVRGLDKM